MRYYLIALCFFSFGASATEFVRIGAGSPAQGAANVIGLTSTPLDAISGNPALLADSHDFLQVSATAAYVDSEFTSSLGEKSSAERGPGVLPDFAHRIDSPIPGLRFAYGAYVNSAMRADFSFLDPPGTLGVSYGNQKHLSEYIAVNFVASASYELSDKTAIGATIGAVYNRNRLESPYIFQSHSALAGLKVLVDLEADDVAFTGRVGLRHKLSDDLRLYLSHGFESDFSAEGKLKGNIAALGFDFQPHIEYDAKVKTGSPANTSVGIVWDVNPTLSLGFQYDHIQWDRTFSSLPISLTKGQNNDLNSFLGSDEIFDEAPLNWKNQNVFHAGIQYLTPRGWTLRLGFEHSSSVPVNRAVLTPLTGAIFDSAYSLGMSIPKGQGIIDLSYRWTRGADAEVINSQLLGGEYSGTTLNLDLHSLTVSYRR